MCSWNVPYLFCPGYNGTASESLPFPAFSSVILLRKQSAWLFTSIRRLDILSALSSITDLKRIQTPHSLFWDFGAYKTFTTRWSGGRVQVWVQVQSLPVIWQSLQIQIRVSKAFPEDNRRFWQQNQWLSSWGRTQAQLARVGLVRSNTGNFQVGGSRCWHWATGSLEENVLSCDADSVQESKVLMPCGYWAAKSHLFLCKMKFLMELARYCCRPASPIA